MLKATPTTEDTKNSIEEFVQQDSTHTHSTQYIVDFRNSVTSYIETVKGLQPNWLFLDPKIGYEK